AALPVRLSGADAGSRRRPDLLARVVAGSAAERQPRDSRRCRTRAARRRLSTPAAAGGESRGRLKAAFSLIMPIVVVVIVFDDRGGCRRRRNPDHRPRGLFSERTLA